MGKGAIITCRCGCERTGHNHGNHLLAGCHKRWRRAGKPAIPPRPPAPRETQPPWEPTTPAVIAAAIKAAQLSDRRYSIEWIAGHLDCSDRHVYRLAAAGRRILAAQQEGEDA
ncbi:hypothetical protein GCM10009555_018110 [Acrocarpospora macrocephala]|uniref:Uncharacterized protein n=1 Tax=Acrocarpospora macrocephala TaxID=150177 RepID=A0A5M3WJU8_9ACTN|nr:hypothetical protein [Acrocarpospora macrocephala]GES07471.1 hypothetical protein Amac_010660 [Acrocarpospora macrocephala]